MQFEEPAAEKASAIIPGDWSESLSKVPACPIDGNFCNSANLSDGKHKLVTRKPRVTVEVQKGAKSCKVVCDKPLGPFVQDDAINEEEEREGHGCMKKGKKISHVDQGSKGPGQSGMVEAGGGVEAQSSDSMNVVIGSFRKKRKGGGLKDLLAFGLNLRHLRRRATRRPRSKQRTELKLARRGLASSSEDKVERGLKPTIGAAQRFRQGQCDSTPILSRDTSGGCASSASTKERGSTEMNRDRASTEHYEAEGRKSKSPPPTNKVARLQSMDELKHDCLRAE
ncbi:hypothetical protein Ancab_030968 [Ancistrocladus abbreviatus]